MKQRNKTLAARILAGAAAGLMVLGCLSPLVANAAETDSDSGGFYFKGQTISEDELKTEIDELFGPQFLSDICDFDEYKQTLLGQSYNGDLQKWFEYAVGYSVYTPVYDKTDDFTKLAEAYQECLNKDEITDVTHAQLTYRSNPVSDLEFKNEALEFFGDNFFEIQDFLSYKYSAINHRDPNNYDLTEWLTFVDDEHNTYAELLRRCDDFTQCNETRQEIREEIYEDDNIVYDPELVVDVSSYSSDPAGYDYSYLPSGDKSASSSTQSSTGTTSKQSNAPLYMFGAFMVLFFTFWGYAKQKAKNRGADTMFFDAANKTRLRRRKIDLADIASDPVGWLKGNSKKSHYVYVNKAYLREPSKDMVADYEKTFGKRGGR